MIQISHALSLLSSYIEQTNKRQSELREYLEERTSEILAGIHLKHERFVNLERKASEQLCSMVSVRIIFFYCFYFYIE